jgi:hypothetical protein
MYRQILFAAIHGAYPTGQLKLFSFIPNKFSGKDDSNLKPAFRQGGMKVQYWPVWLMLT